MKPNPSRFPFACRAVQGAPRRPVTRAVVSVGSGIRRTPHRKSLRAAREPTLLTVLLLGAMLLGVTAWPGWAQTISDYRIGDAQVGGDFALRDHEDRPAKLADFRGKVVVLVFGYTHCPDICPLTLVEVAAMMKALGEEQSSVQPLLITVDPVRDTPAVLRDFVRHFHPRLIGLTGSADEIGAVAELYRTMFMKMEGEAGEGHRIGHTGYIYLLDRRGAVQYVLPHDSDATRMLAGVKSLLADA